MNVKLNSVKAFDDLFFNQKLQCTYILYRPTHKHKYNVKFVDFQTEIYFHFLKFFHARLAYHLDPCTSTVPYHLP